MNGVNKIVLNGETLMEAVDFWLKSTVMKDEEFEVVSIKPMNTGMGGFGEFEIELHGTEKLNLS